MCRLVGVIARKPVNASEYLLDAPQSLFVQSQIDKKRKQGDGWGLGWFEAGRPRIFKSPRPIYRDRARLQSAVKKPCKTQALVGHIRWASNPLKLPHHELIGLTHTQPFQQGEWLFVHNGTLYIPREVKAALGPWARYVQGKNDSEVLFYWLMKHLQGTTDIVGAVRRSITGLHKIWKTCKKQYPLYAYPYHGLNWVLTNGRRLVAFNYVDPRGLGKSKAFCNPKQPYYELQIQNTGDQITVASEPLNPGSNWQPLGQGRLLWVENSSQGLKMKTLRVI